MRVLAIAVLVALAVSAPAAAQQKPVADSAYQLVGTWSCESIAHSAGTMVVTRDTDNQISLKNRFVTAGGLQGEFDELYTLDPSSGHWAVSATDPGRPGFLETMTAGPWRATSGTSKATSTRC